MTNVMSNLDDAIRGLRTAALNRLALLLNAPLSREKIYHLVENSSDAEICRHIEKSIEDTRPPVLVTQPPQKNKITNNTTNVSEEDTQKESNQPPQNAHVTQPPLKQVTPSGVFKIFISKQRERLRRYFAWFVR